VLGCHCPAIRSERPRILRRTRRGITAVSARDVTAFPILLRREPRNDLTRAARLRKPIRRLERDSTFALRATVRYNAARTHFWVATPRASAGFLRFSLCAAAFSWLPLPASAWLRTRIRSSLVRLCVRAVVLCA